MLKKDRFKQMFMIQYDKRKLVVHMKLDVEPVATVKEYIEDQIPLDTMST